MRSIVLIALFGMVLLYGCAPSRYVKPLSKGEHAVHGNLGGAMAKVPGVGAIPIPFTGLGYGYGLEENTTLFGTWHTTSALFGVAQFDIGVSQTLWKTEKMGLTIQPQANVMWDVPTGATRLYPQVDANYYLDYSFSWFKEEKSPNYFYVGISNWFELQSRRAHGVKQQQHWIFSPQIGHVFQFKRLDFGIEGKYLAPFASNEDIVVDYVSPGDKGALGLFFNFQYTLKR